MTEQVAGFVATGLLVWSSRRAHEGPLDLRFFGVWALILGFGLLWTVVFNTFDARSANAFWATLFMFVYAVAGLWLGRGFLILGLAITALTVAGYFWAGAAFPLYMALVNGGGMIVCGLWMRRA